MYLLIGVKDSGRKFVYGSMSMTMPGYYTWVPLNKAMPGSMVLWENKRDAEQGFNSITPSLTYPEFIEFYLVHLTHKELYRRFR